MAHAVKDFNITLLAGMMPNQAHGYCSIEGEAGFSRRWYFRARHGQWELRISSTAASGDAQADLAAAVRGTDLGEFAPPSDSGWLNYDGSGCPVPSDALVEVRFRDGIGDGARGQAKQWNWERDTKPNGGDIVSYRITESPDA